jgi:hypothetical protein
LPVLIAQAASTHHSATRPAAWLIASMARLNPSSDCI